MARTHHTHGQPNPVSEQVASSAVAQPGWLVTILAGIHLVVGGLCVLFVGFLGFVLALIGHGKGGGGENAGGGLLEILLAFFVVPELLFMWVLPLIVFVVGYGLLRRRRWARIGTLILGVFSVLLAGQLLVVGFREFEVEAIMFAAIPVGYALLVLSVLLHQRHAAEFS